MSVVIHELKTWPEPFQAVLDGWKTHEIRVDDRGYMAGDLLRLREYLPSGDHYTGRDVTVEVTYKTPGASWGLPADLCVMSIRRAALPAEGLAAREPELGPQLRDVSEVPSLHETVLDHFKSEAAATISAPGGEK